MSTETIEQATAVATLRERIAQVMAAANSEYEQAIAKERQERLGRLLRTTKLVAHDRLPVELRDEDIDTGDPAETGYRISHFVVEGFHFRVTLERAGHYELTVGRSCARPDCAHQGMPVWRTVSRLIDLAQEGPFFHDFACKYPLDEEGEPIIPESERRKPVLSETDRVIAAVEDAAERLAQAERTEKVDLADLRPLIKAEGIKRIMQRDGIAATPAEKIIETDAEYAAHRLKEADAIVERFRATGAYEAARLRAWSAVRAVGAVE